MKFIELFRNWEAMEAHGPQSVIYSERDPAEVMYFIISGEIELTLNGEVLGTEGEGGIIGEMAIVDSATNSATATTLTEVKLARMDRTELQRIISENRAFSLHVMAVLANRLRAVNKYITIQFDQFT